MTIGSEISQNICNIIGIDCSANPEKCGVAVAKYCDGKSTLVGLSCGDLKYNVHRWLSEFHSKKERCLIALDAPLGWPQQLGEMLSTHMAGDNFFIDAENAFSRTTDKNIRKRFKLKPLEVGADRIARTAAFATKLIASFSPITRYKVPLAWGSSFNGIAAIEVYPAATLKSLDLPYNQYKKSNQAQQRQLIFDGLLRLGIERYAFLSPNALESALENSDKLDAIVCVLAAMKFLEGSAVGPTNLDLALKEGWIWV